MSSNDSVVAAYFSSSSTPKTISKVMWASLQIDLEVTVWLLEKLMSSEPNDEETWDARSCRLLSSINTAYCNFDMEEDMNKEKSPQKRRKVDLIPKSSTMVAEKSPIRRRRVIKQVVLTPRYDDEKNLMKLSLFQLVQVERVLILINQVEFDVNCPPEMRKILMVLRERVKLQYTVIASNTESMRENLSREICPICLEEFGDQGLQHVVRLEECYHKYHRHCILPWLQNKGICPVCHQKSFTALEYFCFSLSELYDVKHPANVINTNTTI